MRASACARVSQFPALTPCCLMPATWSIAGGRFGIQPAVGGGLARQFLHGRQALVDGGGRVALGFEYGAVGLDGGAGEGRSSLLCAPGEEVVERLAVHGAGGGARDGVEDQALDRLERDRGGIRNEAHQTGSAQTAQAPQRQNRLPCPAGIRCSVDAFLRFRFRSGYGIRHRSA